MSLSPILRLLISGLAIVFSAWVLPGVHIEGYFSAIVLAIVLLLLNTFVKPFLVILTLPVTAVTLGLFLLVVNALIILLADYIMADFYVDGFWWALLFSIVLSLTTSLLRGNDSSQQRPNE